MIGQLHHRGWHYALLLALAGVLFFVNLGGAALWDVDEGRNLTCAFEMMMSGNWIVPTFNSDLRIDKPALLYWLHILSFHAFGVNEFAGRFPSALAALCTLLLCYELARSMFSRTTGLYAGVIVVTTPMLCGAARFANPDALLNACTVLTLTLFWLGIKSSRHIPCAVPGDQTGHGARRVPAPLHGWWFVSLGVTSGLAVLAKGPVGVVLPGGVIALFLLWERRLTVVWDRRWAYAFWSFLLIALPWYVWVGIETKGEFLRGFFWRHHLERGLSAMENHSGFPGYYVCVLLAGTAPWSIFLLLSWWFGFWSAVRIPWSRFASWWSHAAEQPLAGASGSTVSEPDAPTRDTPAAYRLLACWIFVYCVFFSVAATKLPNYVLPVIVPSMILIARFLQRWRTGRVQVPSWLILSSVLGLLLFGVVIAVGASMAGWSSRAIPGVAAWAWMGLVPAVAAVAGWWFVGQRQYGRYILTIAITALCLLGPLTAYGSMFFNSFKAPRPLVEQAQALQTSKDIRIGCWQLEHLPSLNFYVQRNVEHFRAEVQLAPFLRDELPVYLFMCTEDWQRLEPSLKGLCRVVGRHHEFYHHTEVVVVTNR